MVGSLSLAIGFICVHLPIWRAYFYADHAEYGRATKAWFSYADVVSVAEGRSIQIPHLDRILVELKGRREPLVIPYYPRGLRRRSLFRWLQTRTSPEGSLGPPVSEGLDASR